MASMLYDAIVVGAGVEGSATAYHLAKLGKRTLLLEQFPLPHTRGSSHGQSRIIRKAYTQSFYSNMMLEAYPLWEQLEKETDTKIYKQTGMLVIGEEGSDALSKTKEALEVVKCRHDLLNPTQLKQRYPMMRFGPTHAGIIDHEAGILHPDRCVAKLQEAFKKFGGTLKDAEKVTDIRPGSVVLVDTNKGQYRTKSLVLTAGPWAGQLTKHLGLNLPLQPLAVTVTYWRQKGGASEHRVGTMPCFIAQAVAAGAITHGASKMDVYGLPDNEYPGHVKICSHGGWPIDPESRDSSPPGVYQADEMSQFVRDHFPGLEDSPSIVERCIYTVTPDEHFFLDVHPRWKNIVIGAGFSGHGFKLAPVVGKVLAEMAVGKKPSYDLTPFKMNRFGNQAKL